MYKCVNFYNLLKKTEKKYRIMFKKLIFGQTYTKFTFAMSTLNQIIEKVNLGSSDSQKNRYIDRENENIGT